MQYEDKNIRRVARNIQCSIRFVIYDIVCGTCYIICYIRHCTSDIRYSKLQHRISKHTISYVQRIQCRITVSYVLIYDITTYDIVCQNIRLNRYYTISNRYYTISLLYDNIRLNRYYTITYV